MNRIILHNASFEDFLEKLRVIGLSEYEIDMIASIRPAFSVNYKSQAGGVYKITIKANGKYGDDGETGIIEGSIELSDITTKRVYFFDIVSKQSKTFCYLRAKEA